MGVPGNGAGSRMAAGPGSHRGMGMIGGSSPRYGDMDAVTSRPTIHVTSGIGGKMLDGTDPNAAPFIPAGNTLAAHALAGNNMASRGGYETSGLSALNHQRTSGLSQPLPASSLPTRVTVTQWVDSERHVQQPPPPSSSVRGGDTRGFGASSMDMISSMFYNGLQSDASFPARDRDRDNNTGPISRNPGMPDRTSFDPQAVQHQLHKHQQQDGGLHEPRTSGGEFRRKPSIGSRVNERLLASQGKINVTDRDGFAIQQQQQWHEHQQQSGQGSGGGHDVLGGGGPLHTGTANRPLKDADMPPLSSNLPGGKQSQAPLDRRATGFNSHASSLQPTRPLPLASNSNNNNSLAGTAVASVPTVAAALASVPTGKYDREDSDAFRKQQKLFKPPPPPKFDGDPAEREKRERLKQERELKRLEDKRLEKEKERRQNRERAEREREAKKARELEIQEQLEREKRALKERTPILFPEDDARGEEAHEESAKPALQAAVDRASFKKEDVDPYKEDLPSSGHVSGNSSESSSEMGASREVSPSPSPAPSKKSNKKAFASPPVSNESMKLFTESNVKKPTVDSHKATGELPKNSDGASNKNPAAPSKESGTATTAKMDTNKNDPTLAPTHAAVERTYPSKERPIFKSLQAFIAKRLGPKMEHHINWLLMVHPLLVLSTMLSHLTSLFMVVISLVLVFSLSLLSVVLRMHESALFAFSMNRHVACSHTFLFSFPYLVNFVLPWAPAWAPVCLWYAFLVQLFCISGSQSLVSTFRLLLPLSLLMEGVSHHSFLLDLNGGELLLISFALSALKTCNVYNPIFFFSFGVQILSAVFGGSYFIMQWCQLVFSLCSLSAMAEVDLWYDKNGEVTRAYHARMARLGKGYSPESGIQFGLSPGADYSGNPLGLNMDAMHNVTGGTWGGSGSAGNDSGWFGSQKGSSRPATSSRKAGYRRRQ
jgi:hypothetical protein